ncbi:MAG: hypothetical protein WCS42_15800 [Verrucomicrobiota bacterium]
MDDEDATARRANRLTRLAELAKLASQSDAGQPQVQARLPAPNAESGVVDVAGQSPDARLEKALQDLEADKKAAAEWAAEHAPELDRVKTLHARLAALPQRDRRAVLDAAGRTEVSAAPPPLERIRGGGGVSIRPKQREGAAADWQTWGDMIQAQVWEAVALSLDLEPEKLPGLDWRAIDGNIFGDCPEEFRRRLKIACNAVDSLALPTESGDYQARSRVVSLAKFARWTTTLNRPWTLPAEFPRGAAPEPAEPAPAVVAAPEPTAQAEPVAAVVHWKPAKPSPVIHKAKRADRLAAVIEMARGQAVNPDDWTSVWAALVELAQSPSRPAPLLGYDEDGVKYETYNEAKPVAWLKRDAFRQRARRQK